jgi:hypothetical protein
MDWYWIHFNNVRGIGIGFRAYFNNLPERSQRNPILEYGPAVGLGNSVSL